MFEYSTRAYGSQFSGEKNSLKIRYSVAEIFSKNPVSFFLGHPVYTSAPTADAHFTGLFKNNSEWLKLDQNCTKFYKISFLKNHRFFYVPQLFSEGPPKSKVSHFQIEQS